MHKPQFETCKENILKFWFLEIRPEQWWNSKDLDSEIEKRFLAVYEQLSVGIEEDLLKDGQDFLAAILVLDQFPRNMFRASARAFATDPLALSLSKQALEKKLDQNLQKDERVFLYMPFQHSEKASDQIRSLELFQSLNDPFSLNFALKHKEIIDRFGRYPHRNTLLGRASTPEEIDFLKQPSLFW